MSFGIIEAIDRLRGDMRIDKRNRNPYRIVLTGKDYSELVYFSCPIYSETTKKIIRKEWKKTKEGFIFEGVNAVVQVEKDSIFLKNAAGICKITFSEAVQVEPSMNGIFVESDNAKIEVKLEFNITGNVVSNSNYFGLIKEGQIPFFVFNGLYGKNKDKLSPLEIENKKLSNTKYVVRLKGNKDYEKICFDMNLYLPKFIFDTTVSSKKRSEGITEECGEEWLYARMDLQKLSDINVAQIILAEYYLPTYNSTQENLKMNILYLPWCSFGATWENKNDSARAMRYSQNLYNYKKLEVTDVIKKLLKIDDPRNISVLIRQEAKFGCTAVATGDNYSMPQILRIKIKGDISNGKN